MMTMPIDATATEANFVANFVAAATAIVVAVCTAKYYCFYCRSDADGDQEILILPAAANEKRKSLLHLNLSEYMDFNKSNCAWKMEKNQINNKIAILVNGIRGINWCKLHILNFKY